jgi:hypothetical protein
VPRRNCSPGAIGNPSDIQLDTDGLRMPPTLFASRSKNFHLSYSWEPFSKSMKKDTMATEFADYMRAGTIPCSVARRLSDGRSFAQQICGVQASIRAERCRSYFAGG